MEEFAKRSEMAFFERPILSDASVENSSLEGDVKQMVLIFSHYSHVCLKIQNRFTVS
jgi:hypothetical protein